GVSVAGTLLERPTAPVRATRSMFGLFAAWSGVLPPSDSCGSSAQPSGMTMAYFMGASRSWESLANGEVNAGPADAAEAVDAGGGRAETARLDGVRHDDQRHRAALLLVEGLVL